MTHDETVVDSISRNFSRTPSPKPVEDGLDDYLHLSYNNQRLVCDVQGIRARYKINH